MKPLRPYAALLSAAVALSSSGFAQVVVDTTSAYRIVNVNSGLSLSLTGDSQTAGTVAIQEPAAALQSERWHFVPEGNGEYLIVNLFTGESVTGGKLALREVFRTFPVAWMMKRQ